jgi:hypothetical protein
VKVRPYSSSKMTRSSSKSSGSRDIKKSGQRGAGPMGRRFIGPGYEERAG